MQAATKLGCAPKETKSPAPDRTDETIVRRLLQQTSAPQPESQAKDDPRANDPNMIVRLLLEQPGWLAITTTVRCGPTFQA
jgi:hypothetical protein